MNRDYEQLWTITEKLRDIEPDMPVAKAVTLAERLAEIGEELKFEDEVERDIAALPTTEEGT